MNFIQAILMGLVEGLTEFLPVSSTGHLILAGRLLGLTQTEFLKSFEIAIQSGAILAAVFLYGPILIGSQNALKKVTAAFLPTAIVGFLLYKTVKQLFLNNHTIVLLSLFAGGIFLILFEHFRKKTDPKKNSLPALSYRNAFCIGLCQSLAVIPGVSRSAATIVAGLALGLDRKTIVEFSFLLAIPTLLAATGIDLLKNAHRFSTVQWEWLAAGALSAFFVAIFAMKFMLRFVEKHDFIPFGIYRIAVAVLFWAFVR